MSIIYLKKTGKMTNVNIYSANKFSTEETLTECWCDFETYDGGDDKDKDSKIELIYSIKYPASGISRVIALSPMDSHGRFADGTSNKVDLNVQGVVRLSDILSSVGTFTLKFEPKGDDTWKFHYTLRMKFNEGTLLDVKAGSYKQVTDQTRQMQE
ncbi:hypothetical protein [Chryseobacterium sp.]|uniref:hypothetical protein n=1 Tax=Chryseobacterium sp. TaxID=1871047 RepID=UPI001B02AD73|nr:hypothetical protein [Chryseobacterium sp.]MBO9692967.1 hypothetical protein [Chryseobacterium sp.]